MKRRIILIVAGILLALAVIAASQAINAPRLQVQVMNEEGEPLKGARIEPDGIRGTDGGHYFWGNDMAVKPMPIETDADGRASIEYPKFITERVRSIELSFRVKHPHYGAERPFVTVASPIKSATPWKQRALFLLKDLRRRGRVEVVRLKRAGTVVVRAQQAGLPVAATNIHVMLEAQEGMFVGTFQREGDYLISKQVPPGLFILRAVCLTDSTNYFSEVESGLAKARETNFFQLALQPGLSVTGRLTGVEGPVVNGWVNARVLSTKPDLKGVQQELEWADYTRVNEDGTFVLRGLPAGRLECVALSDGYVSQRPQGITSGYDVLPITKVLPTGEEVILEMERTAVARVEVRNPEGKPLKGATVGFWPNIQWAQRYSTIFASDFYRSAEALITAGTEHTSKRQFQAETDAGGVAWVRELPGSVRSESSFYVEHEQYDLPLDEHGSRQEQIGLVPGETNYAGIVMQKKGGRPRE